MDDFPANESKELCDWLGRQPEFKDNSSQLKKAFLVIGKQDITGKNFLTYTFDQWLSHPCYLPDEIAETLIQIQKRMKRDSEDKEKHASVKRKYSEFFGEVQLNTFLLEMMLQFLDLKDWVGMQAVSKVWNQVLIQERWTLRALSLNLGMKPGLVDDSLVRNSKVLSDHVIESCSNWKSLKVQSALNELECSQFLLKTDELSQKHGYREIDFCLSPQFCFELGAETHDIRDKQYRSACEEFLDRLDKLMSDPRFPQNPLWKSVGVMVDFGSCYEIPSQFWGYQLQDCLSSGNEYVRLNFDCPDEEIITTYIQDLMDLMKLMETHGEVLEKTCTWIAERGKYFARNPYQSKYLRNTDFSRLCNIVQFATGLGDVSCKRGSDSAEKCLARDAQNAKDLCKTVESLPDDVRSTLGSTCLVYVSYKFHGSCDYDYYDYESSIFVCFVQNFEELVQRIQNYLHGDNNTGRSKHIIHNDKNRRLQKMCRLVEKSFMSYSKPSLTVKSFREYELRWQRYSRKLNFSVQSELELLFMLLCSRFQGFLSSDVFKSFEADFVLLSSELPDAIISDYSNKNVVRNEVWLSLPQLSQDCCISERLFSPGLIFPLN